MQAAGSIDENHVAGGKFGFAHRAADAIRERLDLPETAFRYLTSHGTVDQEHVRFLAQLMDGLDDPDDRAAVVHAARMFFRLYGDIFRSLRH